MTFTAISAETRLIPAFLVGTRDARVATKFLQDLERRLAQPRVQLTSHGHRMYLEAVECAFGRVRGLRPARQALRRRPGA